MKAIFGILGGIVSALACHSAEVIAVAHPGEGISPGKTVVWTPLFQAAWDDLHRELGAPIRIDPPNALMSRLDDFEWERESVMPEGHWRVWAGPATRELFENANQEAAAMLGEKTGPFREILHSGALVALGLLDRDMIFKRPMHRSLAVPLAFQSADKSRESVCFFGTRGKASAMFGGDVRVLAYQQDAHAIEIASNSDDSCVLYLPGETMNFMEACTRLREWRSKRKEAEPGSILDPDLHALDDVRIPVLKLESNYDFRPQLDSTRSFGKAGDPWRIFMAKQLVKFQLTEKGAKIRVKVETGVEPFGGAPPSSRIEPRRFHYDRPFFVFLWRKGAGWPYFGVWIGDASAMERFGKQ